MDGFIPMLSLSFPFGCGMPGTGCYRYLMLGVGPSVLWLTCQGALRPTRADKKVHRAARTKASEARLSTSEARACRKLRCSSSKLLVESTSLRLSSSKLLVESTGLLHASSNLRVVWSNEHLACCAEERVSTGSAKTSPSLGQPGLAEEEEDSDEGSI